MLKAFLLITYGACLGYTINNLALDQKLMRAINEAWENRVRKDAQIIQDQLTRGSYQRSIQEPNEARQSGPIAST